MTSSARAPTQIGNLDGKDFEGKKKKKLTFAQHTADCLLKKETTYL
jgi:hypothetical protein